MREDWIEVELGEAFNITYGKGLSTKDLLKEGYPVYGANGVIGYYSDYKYEERQVLISCRGAASGKINISPEKCFITNNSLIVESSSDFISKEYLYFILSGANRSKIVTGSAQPQVTINNANPLIIKLAPLPIQRAIVSKIEALFSDLDNGIANFKKAQEQLKIYRQAVLKKAFEGELTKEWREKNKIDVNWEITTTGAVMTDINSGSTPTSEFLSTSGDIQFLKVYNLNFDGTLNSTKNPAFTTIEIHNSKNKRAISIAGDVLINIVGPPLGKVSMIPLNSKLQYNINQAIVRFRPNEKIDSKFLSFFMQNPETILWLESMSNTTAGQHNVKVTTCREIPINLPTLQEQNQIIQEIESRLSVCDKVEQSIKESIEKAEALRQSILKKAFEGKLLSQAEIELCKKEADYEPASELLKKIQAEKAERITNDKLRITNLKSKKKSKQ